MNKAAVRSIILWLELSDSDQGERCPFAIDKGVYSPIRVTNHRNRNKLCVEVMAMAKMDYEAQRHGECVCPCFKFGHDVVKKIARDCVKKYKKYLPVGVRMP